MARRLWPSNVSHPDGQMRYWVETERGSVVEFVVQLYVWHDGEWRIVCQFDHTPSQSGGHDVTIEGVHMDQFDHDGYKFGVETANHPSPRDPASALNYAKEYIRSRNEQLIRRWPTWR